jgi:hypothetical protein
MAMSHLHKLGAFEILLWKLLASVIVVGNKSTITKFLSQTHLCLVFLLQPSICLIILLVTVVPPEDFLLSRNIHEKPTRRSEANAVYSS